MPYITQQKAPMFVVSEGDVLWFQLNSSDTFLIELARVIQEQGHTLDVQSHCHSRISFLSCTGAGTNTRKHKLGLSVTKAAQMRAAQATRLAVGIRKSNMDVLNERQQRRRQRASGGVQGREGARDTDRKAGSLLITVVFNIRKCQNGNGAHITLSIALLAAARESGNKWLGRRISFLKWLV